MKLAKLAALAGLIERYWFGKFLDYSTATIAKPDADPDGDGRTNLQEYLDRTDPTTKDTRKGGTDTLPLVSRPR